MRAGLSNRELAALGALRTRDPGDPAIAFLDAGATVLDLLTFYQERIANEAYLRTATERRSILELARLVGYRLRPGVAASGYLAFTLEQGHRITILKGTRVQSVPEGDELPQSFETAEDLEARAEWNALKPRLARPQTRNTIDPGSEQQDGDDPTLAQPPRIYFQGVTTGLAPGDALLLRWGQQMDPDLFVVHEVEPVVPQDRTLVQLDPWESTPILTAFERIRATLGDPGAFRATRGPVAEGVLQLLESVTAMGTAGASDAALVAHLERKVLPHLEAERTTAHTASHARLAAWLDELVPALSRTAAQARRTLRRVEAEARASRVAGTSTGPGILTAVLPKLTVAASVPPRNSRRLARAWPAGDGSADFHLGVLGAFRPDLKPALTAALANAQATSGNPIRAFAFRLKCGLFGSNLPGKATVPIVRGTTGSVSFDPPKLSQVLPAGSVIADKGISTIALDTLNDRITMQSWVAIERSSPREIEIVDLPDPRLTTLHQVIGIRTATMSLEGVSSRSTLLTLSPPWLHELPQDELKRALERVDLVRQTVVHAQTEELPLAEEPVEDDLCDGVQVPIEVQGLVSELATGRWLIVSGERADLEQTSGVQASELVMIAGVQHQVASYEPAPGKPEPLPGDKIHTFITLASPLAYCYRRDTVTIYGNVVNATHGETRKETLGGGDGAQAFQEFTLKASPVTYVAAATAAGTRNTLEVRVNQVRWRESDTLAAAGPADRVFVTSTDDEAKATVVFGDGRRGARLPTGIENVTAVYRTGIGKPGNVKAGQLTLLAAKPLGVKAVVNPLRASGGADADTRDQARRNVPISVRALDRLVSTTDYADFARAFAGIGKAAAIRLPDGRRELVHVTIAGLDDIPILETSDLFNALYTALYELGDRNVPVQLAVRELVILVLAAHVSLLPDYEWESVEPQIRKTLLETFGFDRRELGRSATSSEAIAAIQAVRGVAYVDLDRFGGIPEKVPTLEGKGVRVLIPPEKIADLIKVIMDQGGPAARVRALGPGPEDGGIRPAQLALLSPDIPDSLILNLV